MYRWWKTGAGLLSLNDTLNEGCYSSPEFDHKSAILSLKVNINTVPSFIHF